MRIAQFSLSRKNSRQIEFSNENWLAKLVDWRQLLPTVCPMRIQSLAPICQCDRS